MRSDRTLFYPLPLNGLGTGQVESLSSYVARLAHAHQLKPQTVLNMLLEKVPLSDLKTKARHLCANWDLSSTGVVAQQIVERLEKETGQALASASLARFAHIFATSGFGLPRREERVCRHCVHACSLENLPFGRLLWWVQPVTACPVHKTRLMTASECNAPAVDVLAAAQRPKLAGVCRRCGSLGHACMPTEPEDATEVEVWIAEQVSEMLAMPEELVRRLGEASLRQGLQAVVDERFGGKAVPASLQAGLARATLSTWLKGQFRASLPGVLQICLLASCRLSEVIAGRATSTDAPPLCGEVKRCVGREYVRITLDPEVIRKGLVNAATSSVPPSLQEHCKLLGTNASTVRKRFPTEAKALTAAHRTLLAHQYESRLRDVELVLETAAQQLQAEGVPVRRKTLERATGMAVFSNCVKRGAALKSVLSRYGG